MIYTSYDMIADCRAGKPEGWVYFVVNYVPVIRKLLAHYFSERQADKALIERVLTALRSPETSLFQNMSPAPERVFVLALRQKLLGAVEDDRASAAPEIPLDLETMTSALEPLTVVEKYMVWLETMQYNADDVSRMMRVDPKTVEKVRGHAAELIRGKVDAWRRSLLADNGPVLGRAAAAQSSKDCIPSNDFLDLIDGRSSWMMKRDIERHTVGCWHCVDHYSRLQEVRDILRDSKPLSEEEAAPFQALLGVKRKKPPVWKKVFGMG